MPLGILQMKEKELHKNKEKWINFAQEWAGDSRKTETAVQQKRCTSNKKTAPQEVPDNGNWMGQRWESDDMAMVQTWDGMFSARSTRG